MIFNIQYERWYTHALAIILIVLPIAGLLFFDVDEVAIWWVCGWWCSMSKDMVEAFLK